MITVTPHLNFRGHARAALEFYQSAFGGETLFFSYRDAHMLQSEGGLATEEEADLLSFGQVVSDKGFRIMAYDVQSAFAYDQGERAMFVSVRGDSPEEITAYWNGLRDGATIMADLGPASWGSLLYGMLKDKFGVIWVLDVAAH